MSEPGLNGLMGFWDFGIFFNPVNHENLKNQGSDNNYKIENDMKRPCSFASQTSIIKMMGVPSK